MSLPRVKICGIRDPSDGVAAVDAGADYIGLVFAERIRRLSASEAAEVVLALEDRARTVGVFVDETPDDVMAVHATVGFDIAQLHGSETEEDCGRLRDRGIGVWKAIRPKTRDELAIAFARYAPAADAILVEGFSPTAAGGTGTTFPYRWLRDLDRPEGVDLILAGGLSPENIGAAIGEVAPEIVDVSSGVESAPGVKSTMKIREFIRAVRSAGVQLREVAER
jgi:phosphoribosylanthranilate isomerase